ncbi:hypothetical protein [Synechococcus sp. CC9311]|jgi:hypothetical protein|uniref:hypothetical protein n=1 Tax=Synechococcus sp. (strain CC9311) TaxID=64471 RepID=UPI0000DDB23E|nr:hypothetical protein [Synechococcus sp. CC9311]ABI47406.1 conserved hypothetical protein [Synechococcus sp. CC9311]
MVEISKLLPVLASLAAITLPIHAAASPDPAELADHLSSSKAMYYGSWRCPACIKQTELFGDAANKLPYVECAKPKEMPAQAAACQTAEIRAYPTWILENGQRRIGVQTLEQLKVWTSMPSRP